MDTNPIAELEGQTSINELLDEPVGASPVQLALPIHFQLAVAVGRGALPPSVREVPA